LLRLPGLHLCQMQQTFKTSGSTSSSLEVGILCLSSSLVLTIVFSRWYSWKRHCEQTYGKSEGPSSCSRGRTIVSLGPFRIRFPSLCLPFDWCSATRASSMPRSLSSAIFWHRGPHMTGIILRQSSLVLVGEQSHIQEVTSLVEAAPSVSTNLNIYSTS